MRCEDLLPALHLLTVYPERSRIILSVVQGRVFQEGTTFVSIFIHSIAKSTFVESVDVGVGRPVLKYFKQAMNMQRHGARRRRLTICTFLDHLLIANVNEHLWQM